MAPTSDHTQQEKTLEELRARVERATAEFRRANAERDRLFAISRDVCSGTDGAVAVQKAVCFQRYALLRLREALRDFEAFMSRRR